jgi:hypothetical protein
MIDVKEMGYEDGRWMEMVHNFMGKTPGCGRICNHITARCHNLHRRENLSLGSSKLKGGDLFVFPPLNQTPNQLLMQFIHFYAYVY